MTIQELWESYEKAVVPRSAGPTQRRETRRAFYAGAQAMSQYTMWASSTPDIQRGVRLLVASKRELESFAHDVERGTA